MHHNQLTKELHTTIMAQTYEHIQSCSELLHLSEGEVIDRALTTIATKDPWITATWVCDQFIIAASDQSDEEQQKAAFLVLGIFLRSLLDQGLSQEYIVKHAKEITDVMSRRKLLH